MAQRFLELKDKFEWFILIYFGKNKYNELIKLAKDDSPQLANELDKIWFELPDHIFNIQNNPPGWHEFLSIIEDLSRNTFMRLCG